MARKCHITGLGTVYGNKRPHLLKASAEAGRPISIKSESKTKTEK